MSVRRRDVSDAVGVAFAWVLAAVIFWPIHANTVTAATVPTNVVEITEANLASWDDDVQKTGASNSGDRWEKFEQDFGIKQESPSTFGRMIQSAKYKLDTMCFTAMEGAKELEFTHDFGVDSETAPGWRNPITQSR